MESTWSSWSLHGVLQEFTWSPCGVHVEFMWTSPNITLSLLGINMDLTWTLYGVYMDSTWSPDIILIKRRLFRESLYNPGRTDQGLCEDSHIIKSPHSHLKKCDLFKDRTHALFNDFGTIKNTTLNHSTISPWTFKETGQISTYRFDAAPHQPNKQRLAPNIPAFPQPTSLRPPHRTLNDKRQQPPQQQQHQHLTMPATRSQA
jgi:hypothetical protein